MWVKRAHKTTLQEAFSEAILVEKDMFFLKDNPDIQIYHPSTSRRRKENVPKTAPQNKDPYDMENMKKLLQKISNDMVYIKRNNNDNKVNNRGMARSPFRRHYQPPQNQPPNPEEMLASDEIYSSFKALASRTQTHDDSRDDS